MAYIPWKQKMLLCYQFLSHGTAVKKNKVGYWGNSKRNKTEQILEYKQETEHHISAGCSLSWKTFNI